MRKIISALLIIVGLLCLIYGGWQIFSSKLSQNEALKEAKAMLEKNDVDKDQDIPENYAPEIDKVIGILKIPKIKSELPIFEGTDEDELEKGVGHYKGTAFPGGNDQIVLSGHRDTVFRKLGELKVGDELIVQMSYGDFIYVIEDTDIVDADDTTVIRSTAPEEVLTLTTCYPFSFIGNAPQRYIIYATPKK